MLDRSLRTFGHAWINVCVIAITVAALIEAELLTRFGAPAIALLILTPGILALAGAERTRKHGRQPRSGPASRRARRAAMT